MSDVALEPFSPRALFLAGHQTQWVGAWFQRVLMGAQLATSPDPDITAYQQRLMTALKEERAFVAPVVRAVGDIVHAHGIEVPTPPRTPDDWEPWAMAIFRGFASKMDPKSPQSAPFAFGWEHGRARATLAVLVTAIEMQAKGVERQATIVAGIHDLTLQVKRWPASATVMSQLDDTTPVLVVFREAHAAMLHLSRADAAKSDADTLRVLSASARQLLELLAAMEETALTTLPTTA